MRSEDLAGIGLRGILACVARTTERIEPLLAGVGKDAQRYRNATDMAWSFAAGGSASVLQTWRVVRDLEVLSQRSGSDKQPPHDLSEAMREAALAAHTAYSAAESYPPPTFNYLSLPATRRRAPWHMRSQPAQKLRRL
jgi:hypothetical protein